MTPTSATTVPHRESKPGRTNGDARGHIGRDRVMAEATKMFLSVGYAGTSLKRIASELGVSAPALYWYFPSKEDLYIEVIEASIRDFVEFVRTAITATEPLEQLEQLVRAHVTWQLDQTESARAFDLSRVQTPSIPTERLEPTRQLQIEYRGDVRLLLQRGLTLGVFDIDEIKVTASAIITMCEYSHTWFNPQGPLTVAEVADQIVGLARRMVGVPAVESKGD